MNGNKNFALIYNPDTQEDLFFVESDSQHFTLCISPFEGTSEKLYFQESNFDTNCINNISLLSTNDTSIPTQQYLKYTNSAIKNIENSELNKIVISNKITFVLNAGNQDIETYYQKLKIGFPNTYVYLYYINNTIWLGASPEMIGTQKNGIFKTISLAGTQKNGTLLSSKESKEQQIVSDYISEALNFKHSKDNTPQEVLNFGNIQHFVSNYEMPIDNEFDFDKTVNRIHPSPALSGFPIKESLKFISNNEPFEREIYCSLSNITLSPKEKFAFANIRCVKISKNQATYYAGGGITNESIADKEYNETIDKMLTIAAYICPTHSAHLSELKA